MARMITFWAPGTALRMVEQILSEVQRKLVRNGECGLLDN
jgi:hypothetical protein